MNRTPRPKLTPRRTGKFYSGQRQTGSNCCLTIAIVLAAIFLANSTNAQETSTVSAGSAAPTSEAPSAKAPLTKVRSATNPEIARLLEIQKKVQRVVALNTEPTVAVTDGIGFGTGAIVSESGLVLTAGHVMTTGGRNWEVIFPSGKTAKCRPLGKNLNIDAGMLQIIEPGKWPYVELENETDSLQKGDWVVSLGHSGGFELGRNPPVRTGKYLYSRENQIVTDAVLIGGDSGGPLYNLEGRLIAIHSSIGEHVAENRHVPIALFRKSWDRMKKGETWGKLPQLDEPEDALKKTRRGKLGITMDRTAPNALVKGIQPGSPAGNAGVQVGDVVVEVDGINISNSGQLIDLIKKKRALDVCSILVLRNGGYYRYQVKLMPSR